MPPLAAVLALASAVIAIPIIDRRALTPTVKINSGTIKGKFSSDYTVASFFNIPYAVPPVGNLRFRPPQPPAAFSGVYDATKMGNSCMQGPAPQFYGGVNQNNSEDCLNLNVFVPTEGLKAGAKLPVVVYIYGGSFNDGYNNLPIYDGANVIKAQPLFGRSIIVVPNYRTNIFGFATSNELLAEGGVNVGLLDQKAVFEWVRNNIGNFGGDPDKVTAWGESAGAINIATHMVSGDVTKPLFDRAVLESGAVFAFANIPSLTQPAFDALVAAVGCSGKTPVLDCLRKVPAQKLFDSAAAAGVSYLPAVDGKYVKQQPQVALSKGQIYKIPAILLDNNDEGTFFTTSVTDETSLTALEKSFSFLGDAGVAKAQQIYPLSKYPSAFAAAADFYGDAVFKCPERLLAKTLTAAGQPVFKGRFSVLPTVVLPAGKDFFPKLGVYHTAEMPFVWSFQQTINQSNGEKAFSRKMISAFSDFFGGRTPGSSVGISWPTFGTAGKRIVWQLTNNGAVETLDAAFNARCDFWDQADLAFSTAINA
ncbi:hypothetical protein HK105_204090 [Polyrhizophydium stewartii]|uniref:Carboxylesterase type B domain-containing protein n=1 Tax=Polyrhizophydium stewartii TaxID=2732419 RepID=A0ABR4NA39_9FUNG